MSNTKSVTFWIPSGSLDSSGSMDLLPVYVGNFDAEGRPDFRNLYPIIVGYASARIGRITHNGIKYVATNLRKNWRQDDVYFLRLDEILES